MLLNNSGIKSYPTPKKSYYQTTKIKLKQSYCAKLNRIVMPANVCELRNWLET